MGGGINPVPHINMNKICSNCGMESNRFKFYVMNGKVEEFCPRCIAMRTNMENFDNVGLLHNSGNNKHAPQMSMVERRHLESRKIENINGKNVVTYPKQFKTKYHR